MCSVGFHKVSFDGIFSSFRMSLLRMSRVLTGLTGVQESRNFLDVCVNPRLSKTLLNNFLYAAKDGLDSVIDVFFSGHI